MSMDVKLKITDSDIVYVGDELGVPVKIETEAITYVGNSEYVRDVLDYSLECAKVKRDIKGQGIRENFILVLPVILLLIITGVLIDRHLPVKHQVEVVK
jgi:hypothetical protein